ncbi:unnamed protein product [Mesocestoides corti]|uniref:C2H2-type domain-containing protein n=2 Tax=Mesocestoides corti TaxID=53468 RepID=A0A158QTS8_MESCO|nr:unnamed protein product [Mesocestoides corti]
MRLLHKQDKAPNRFFRSLEDVIRHDTQCIKRWLMLMETICSAQVYNQAKNNKSQTLEALSTLLPEGLRWIGLNDVLEKLAFADGNSTLPFPPQTSVEAYNFVKSRHQPGPFELIAEKFHKSQCTANDSVAIREQQLTVIEKLISLFKNMDFSIFTEPLMNDDSLTFNMLCRDWLITDPNTELLEQPSPPKQLIRSAAYNHRRARQLVGTSDAVSNTRDNHRFVCPIPSCLRARPEGAFKRRYLLREHLNFHRKEQPFCCNRCPKRFTSRQNLARHRLAHAGTFVNNFLLPKAHSKFLLIVVDYATVVFRIRSQTSLRFPCFPTFLLSCSYGSCEIPTFLCSSVTYTCPECRHVFVRSSDRSKCLRNHRLQRSSAEEEVTSATPSTVVAKPANAIMAFGASKATGPYICPVCPGQRDYKLDSSLRKHIRLHHPDYKRSPTCSQLPRGDHSFAKAAPPQSMVGSKRTPVENETVVNYSLKTAAVADVSESTSQLQTGGGTSAEAYILSTGELIYATDTQYPAYENFIPIGGGTDGSSNEQRPAILMELTSTRPATVGEDPRRLAHSAVLDTTEGSLLLTHCLPVDLCTSALCLTVTDAPVPTSLSSTNQQHTVIPVDPAVCPSMTEGALDLTDIPHEVIDLSHSHPVDLSGTHPQPPRPSMWEPEPGFSFTDLLNVDDEDPRGLLLADGFESGLDLRLPEPL